MSTDSRERGHDWALIRRGVPGVGPVKTLADLPAALRNSLAG